MTNINLSSNLETIGEQAFNNCTSLTQVIIPASVKRIGDKVFRHCVKLNHIIFMPETQPSLLDWYNKEITINEVLDNRAGLVDVYVTSSKTYSFGTELISIDDIKHVYDGKSPNVTWHNNTPWTVSFVTSGIPYSAGEHKHMVAATFSEPINRRIEIPIIYAIDKAPLKLTVNNQTKVYGANNGRYTGVYEGFVNGENEASNSIRPEYYSDVENKTSVGDYPIDAYVDTSSWGVRNYNLEIIPGTYTITKAPLTVVAQDASKEYGDANPVFLHIYEGLRSWDSASNLVLTKPIVFSTDATDASAVGEYNVTPSGGETSNYEFVSYRGAKLTVNKATLTVTPNIAERFYGDNNPEFTASLSGFKLGETSVNFTKPIAFKTSADKLSNVGMYDVSASDAESANYTFKYNTGTLTIKKAPITIGVNNATRMYGESNPAWDVVYTGLKNNDTAVRLYPPLDIRTADNMAAAGIYDINVSGGDCENYVVTEFKNGKLTITKAPLTVIAIDSSREYGDPNPSFNYQFEGLKSWDNASDLALSKPIEFTTDATETSGVGVYNVIPSKGETANYEFASYRGAKLTVNKATLTVTPNSEERLYGDNNPNFTASLSGFKLGETSVNYIKPIQYTTSANTLSNVGKYDIIASDAECANYSFKYNIGTLSINKAPITIAVNNATRMYGESNPTWDIVYTGLKNDETSVSLNPPLEIETVDFKSNAGTYDINISGGECSNYVVSEFKKGLLTITKAPLTVIANDNTREYGDPNPDFSYQLEGLKSWDNIESLSLTSPIQLMTSATEYSNVGMYDIVPSGGVTQNYDFTEYRKAQLSVSKAEATITPNSVSREYGDANPVFTASFEGLKLGETTVNFIKPVQFTTTATIGSGVGLYIINASDAEAINYSFKYNTGTLVVNKAPVELRVVNTSRMYGDNNPDWKFEFTGLKNGEQTATPNSPIKISTSASVESEVGIYDVTPSEGIFDNYIVASYYSGKLEIMKAPLTIQVKNASKLYGTENPLFEVEYEGAKDVDRTAEGYNVVFSTPYTIVCQANPKSACGEYSVAVKGGEAKNYDIVNRISGVLNVTQQSLVVTPVNVERVYGTDNPKFEVVYSGFVNGDNKEALTSQPTVVTTATKTSLPGEYPLTIVGGESHNYAFQFATGTLTIKKNTLKFACKEDSTTYNGEAILPQYVCDGDMTVDKLKSLLKIKKHVFIPEYSYWTYVPVTEIRDAGKYEIELSYSDETLDAHDIAYYTVAKAESELEIENIEQLKTMKVGNAVVLEWKSNAPHTTLTIMADSSAPVKLESVNEVVSGQTITKYRIVPTASGNGILRLCADGSPNHLAAVVEIPVSVVDESGVEEVSADNFTIKVEDLTAIVSGKSIHDDIYVFDVSGNLIYNGKEERIYMPHHGIYVFYVNGKSIKISL